MIPYRLNPLGISGGDPLLDKYTRFLLKGDKLKDLARNTTINNFGLYSEGGYICASTSTSYAVIPANALAEDVLVADHDWSLEICFFAPAEIGSYTADPRLFGEQGRTAAERLDVYFRRSDRTLGIGGMMDFVQPPTVSDADNLFVVCFKVGNGFTWAVNGTRNTANRQHDIMTPRNIRTSNLAILAQWNNDEASAFAHTFKIKYIRISNIVRLA